MRISDWSPDVCSSDLPGLGAEILVERDAIDDLRNLIVLIGVEEGRGVEREPPAVEAVLRPDFERRHIFGFEGFGERLILNHRLVYIGARRIDRKSTRLNSSH